MKITIDCKIDISEEDCIELVSSLLKNRKPKNCGFNYGLETHGVLSYSPVGFPIHVFQTNDRKSNKSPICLKIEKHVPIF